MTPGLVLIFAGAAYWFYRALTQPRRDREAKQRKEHRLAVAKNNTYLLSTGKWLPKVEPWRPA